MAVEGIELLFEGLVEGGTHLFGKKASADVNLEAVHILELTGNIELK